jgi:hypothetical protein
VASLIRRARPCVAVALSRSALDKRTERLVSGGELSAQREIVASGDETLVGAAKQVFAQAAGHQRYRIVTAVQRP